MDENSFTSVSTNSSLTLQASDRGCDLRLPLIAPTPSSNGYSYYLQTFSNLDCGLDAGWSRVVAMGATELGNSTTLTNLSVVSCTTSYHESIGKLSIALSEPEGSANLVITSFASANNTLIDRRPLYADAIENAIHQPSSFDNTATLSATDLGRLIFTYALAQNPQSFLTSATISNATQQIFGALFPLIVRKYLLQPVPLSNGDPATETQGILSVNKTRLLVVWPIA